MQKWTRFFAAVCMDTKMKLNFHNFIDKTSAHPLLYYYQNEYLRKTAVGEIVHNDTEGANL
jgi:hypothetical protein